MDDSALDQLFSGDVDRLIPLPKRVVRLFISSTFTDMMLERNSLMERVYPRLKKYCRENHGLDFQVVDMRWGVRDEATDDHQTANLCSREIDNCQRMSLGPNFVALLGDKYGFRPLCNKIKSNEYRALRRCLIELDISTDLLDTWYKEDLNAVPAEYLLQPISSILKNFTNRDEPELQAVDQRFWQAIQERLHELLMTGSSRLVKQGRMSEQEQLMKYSISVTEREVIEGCLNVKDARSSCLVYVRSISSIHEHLEKCLTQLYHLSSSQQEQNNSNNNQILPGRRDSQARRASIKMGADLISVATHSGQNASERRYEKIRRLIGKYVDLSLRDEVWTLDREAQDLLANLKGNKLETKMKNSSKNLTKYKITWDEQEGMSLKCLEHKQYLNDLSEHFYTKLTRMIRKAAKNEQGVKSGLIGEVLQHSHYAKHVSKSFYGRFEELEKIRSYILCDFEDDNENLKPMFVYGVAGSGKTSVLARSACLAKEWIMRSESTRHGFTHERWDQKPCIIMRFCCTTPSSSSMVGVLMSVCRQLQFNFYQYGSLNGVTNQSIDDAGRMLDGESGSSVSQEDDVRKELEQQLPCEPIPEDLVRLVFKFHQLLDNCRHKFHRKRLFLIILDSVERLSAPTSCSVEVKYSWLTSVAKLPANVRLIVSCSSERVLNESSAVSHNGKSGSSSSSNINADYRYLKRQFLQVYFPLRSERKMHHSSGCGDEEDDSEDELGCSSKGLDEIGKDNYFVQPSSNLQLGESRSSDFSISEQLAAESSRRPGRVNWVKRLLIPTVRLRRGSAKVLQKTATAEHMEKDEKAKVVEKEDFSPFDEQEQKKSDSPPPASVSPLVTHKPDEEDERLSELSREVSEESNSVGKIGTRQQSPQGKRREGKRWNQVKRREAHLERVRMLHVRPMGVELALCVLQRWLAEFGRCLSQQQWLIVRKSLLSCSRPIFVKLAFGEIVNWKSYSMQSDSRGPTFGSALLESKRAELESELISSLAFNDKDALLMQRLLTRCSYLEQKEPDSFEGVPSDEVKMHVFCIEQHWLNYLSYRRLRDRSAEEWNKEEEDERLKKEKKQACGSSNKVHLANSKRKSDDNSADVKQELVMKVKVSQSNNNNNLSGSICHLSNTIEAAICQLFARIELQHGYLLTKHSLSYITASRNGICENELEDILSLDDVVLDDVFQYHLPPVRRIPPLLWTRIRNDLADYLSERDADGIVVNWHHNQFKQVARRRYMSEPRQLYYIHSTLADYFLGRWADQPKPFKCTRQQMLMASEQLDATNRSSTGSTSTPSTSLAAGRQSTRLLTLAAPSAASQLIDSSAQSPAGPAPAGEVRSRMRSSGSQQDQRLHLVLAKADRRVPQQPLYYKSSELENSLDVGTSSRSEATIRQNRLLSEQQDSLSTRSGRRYNLRKLTELPFHLMRSGRYLDLANEVLFNYKWLFAALDASGLQSLLSTFDEAAQSLSNALKEQRENNKEDEISNNLEGDKANRRAEHPDFLTAILDQLRVLNDTVRLSCSAIHSDTQMLAPQLIGRLLPLVNQRTGKIGENSSQVKNNYLSQLLTQCDHDGCWDCALLPTDHCLQSPDGLLLSSLEGHSFAITSMSLCSDQRHLLAVSNRFVMWDISTGEVSRDVDPKIEGSIMCQLKMSLDDHYAIAYTSDNLILALNILTQQVSKFQATNLDADERLVGLALIDELGGTKFTVWSRSRWFVLRLKSNNQPSNAGSIPQKVNIELLYSLHMNCLPESACMDQILAVQLCVDDSNSELTLLEVKIKPYYIESSGDDDKQLSVDRISAAAAATTEQLELITGEVKESETEGWIFKPWKSRQKVSAASYKAHFRQLIYADGVGDLFLSRRRNRCWSKGKLLLKFNENTQATVKSNSVDKFRLKSIEGEEEQPLAIEIDSLPDPDGIRLSERENFARSSSSSWDELEYSKLAKFERQVDAVEQGNHELDEDYVFKQKANELVSECSGKQEQSYTVSRSASKRRKLYESARVVKVYLANKIVVLYLGAQRGRLEGSSSSSMMMKRTLLLPRNLQNISVQLNQCQIRAIILGQIGEETGKSFLVAASARVLLLYSLDNEQFLRSINAHTARIVQLLPVLWCTQVTERVNESSEMVAASSSAVRLVVASASLDKTVKIWNLSNLDKDVDSLEKLEGAISSISLAREEPLAACLARTELGIWDWRKLELLARIGPSQLTGANRSSRLLCCSLSSNGAYLGAATLSSLHVFTLTRDPDYELAREERSRCTSKPLPELHFKCELPAGAQATRLSFFHGDSKLLAILEENDVDSPEREENSLSIGQQQQQQQLSRKLRLLCYSIPTSVPERHAPLYEIHCNTPILSATNESHYLSTQQQPRQQRGVAAADLERRKMSALTATRSTVRLPVLTKDELYLVTVESESGSTEQLLASMSGGRARKSSSLTRLATLLCVYSAKNGEKLRNLELSKLKFSPSGTVSFGINSSNNNSNNNNRLQGDNLNWTNHESTKLVAVDEQFNRIKSVRLGERKAVIALLDSERASPSCLVDVESGQLLVRSSLWNGKLTRDGRFGLGMMFKAASLRATRSGSLKGGAAASGQQQVGAGGLQLLEMRRCLPIKWLLSSDQLARLFPAAHLQTTGSDSDITCGFAGPDDAYAYYYDLRLGRLLLIELAESRLLANFKPPLPLTRIKSSPLGEALVLGLADGSLTAMALVDPRRAESLAKLAEYPSRKLRSS